MSFHSHLLKKNHVLILWFKICSFWFIGTPDYLQERCINDSQHTVLDIQLLFYDHSNNHKKLTLWHLFDIPFLVFDIQVFKYHKVFDSDSMHPFLPKKFTKNDSSLESFYPMDQCDLFTAAVSRKKETQKICRHFFHHVIILWILISLAI